MKLRIPKLIGLFFLIGTLSGNSQTLNWGSLTNSTIVDSQGAALDNTYLIQIGAFDTTFIPNGSNIAQWTDHWHAFDTADYSYNTTDLGYFTGTENLQNVTNYSSMFEGLTAYLLIRNTAKTEYFLATTESTAEWKFPALDTGCCPTGTTTWSVSNLAPDTPIWGGHDDKEGGGDYVAPGPFDLQTHAVPEPSVSLIAMLGCGFALMRRRRSFI